MDQGRFFGRHSSTSSEKSEKSTSYSMRMPSVSGSISPAWPSVLASLLVGGTEEGRLVGSQSHLLHNNVGVATLTLLQSCCYLASRWYDIWTGCCCSRLDGWQSLGDSRWGGRWSAAHGGPQGRTWRKACRGETSGSRLQPWSVSSQQCRQPGERSATINEEEKDCKKKRFLFHFKSSLLPSSGPTPH